MKLMLEFVYYKPMLARINDVVDNFKSSWDRSFTCNAAMTLWRIDIIDIIIIVEYFFWLLNRHLTWTYVCLVTKSKTVPLYMFE